MIEDMAQLHMTEAELARDLHAVLEKVRQGVEVVVDHDCQPVAVLRASDPPRRRVSEVLALMPKDSTATMDAGFARDIQAAVGLPSFAPAIHRGAGFPKCWRSCQRTPPRRWTPASPAISKPPSTAIANRWTRRRGTDPRFLRGHRGGAPGPDRVPDAGGDWRAGRRQISASGDGQIHLA